MMVLESSVAHQLDEAGFPWKATSHLT